MEQASLVALIRQAERAGLAARVRRMAKARLVVGVQRTARASLVEQVQPMKTVNQGQRVAAACPVVLARRNWVRLAQAARKAGMPHQCLLEGIYQAVGGAWR